MPTINDVTQPGGQPSRLGSEGPIHIGQTPRKITHPFSGPQFYLDSLRQVSRGKNRDTEPKLNIIVRSKREIPAGGHGVFCTFNKGR